MNVLTVSEARSNLYRVVDNTISNHEPTFIKGKRGNVVMIGEEDWRSLQETIYLSSIPGMMESIIEAANTPIEECVSEIEFWPGK